MISESYLGTLSQERKPGWEGYLGAVFPCFTGTRTLTIVLDLDSVAAEDKEEGCARLLPMGRSASLDIKGSPIRASA